VEDRAPTRVLGRSDFRESLADLGKASRGDDDAADR